MKYRILSKTEKDIYGANIAVTVDYTDLVALGAVASGVINLAPLSGNLAAGYAVQLIGTALNTPFVGSDSPTTCNVTVGDAGSANRYLTTTELLGSAAYVSYSAGTGTRFALTAAGPISATFTDTAKSLANLTAGNVTFFLRLDDLTALPIP
jgi:hypothetical protein